MGANEKCNSKGKDALWRNGHKLACALYMYTVCAAGSSAFYETAVDCALHLYAFGQKRRAASLHLNSREWGTEKTSSLKRNVYYTEWSSFTK